MRTAHSVADVRAAEKALMATLPEGTLMQRASTALARRCADLLDGVYGARVVLLVGSGGNGGDAMHAGALLARRGARVDALLLMDRAQEAGLSALRRAGGRVATVSAVDDDVRRTVAASDLVVDGVVGLGSSRPIPDTLVQLLEDVRGIVVAVDLPSGIDADTGALIGDAAVRADVTITFGTHKPGLLVDPGAAHAGVVERVDIGLELDDVEPAAESWQLWDVAAWLDDVAPTATSDKYSRGAVGILAGSARYPGACVLTTGAALHATAGYVRVAAGRGVAGAVRLAWPEAVVSGREEDGDPTAVGRVQAWAAGPGIGTDDEARDRLQAVLDADLPTVLDADALTLVAGDLPSLTRRTAPTLLTPHAGELARLLGTDRASVEARRLEHVRRAADLTGAVVLLKGSTTLVAGPGRPVQVNPTGTPWLAAAGSGDVLTGLCGALMAAKPDAVAVGAVGAWLQGLAGRLASDGGPISASDLVRSLPDAFRAVAAHAG